MKLRRVATVFIVISLLVSIFGVLSIMPVSASNSTVWKPSPGTTYNPPIENNVSSGKVTDTAFDGKIENRLSLCAYVAHIDTDCERTLVEIAISGVGYGEK